MGPAPFTAYSLGGGSGEGNKLRTRFCTSRSLHMPHDPPKLSTCGLHPLSLQPRDCLFRITSKARFSHISGLNTHLFH